MAENKEIASLFKSMGLPIPRQFSTDPESFLTQLVKQYSKGGDTTAPKTPVKKQDFLGAVEKAASEPDFGVTKEGVADKLLKGKLTDPQPTREQAVNTALEKAKADLDLEEAHLKKLHLAEREREQAVNTALEKAEGAREDAMTAALAKVESDLDVEEEALKKEHLDTRKADRQAEVAAKAKEPVTRGDLDPDMQDMMGTTGVDPDDYDLAGVAEEPEVDYTDKAISLFKNTHGSDFDPNSVKDKGKLEDMKKLLAQNKGKEMSPNQFALQFYREYP